MKHTLHQVFRSSNFVIGFTILVAILLVVIIYPLIITDAPLEIIAQGSFFPPGTYVNVYDSIGTTPHTLLLDDAEANRIDSKLSMDDRLAMHEWLVAFGIPEEEIDIFDTEKLLALWDDNFDPTTKIPGMTNAQRNYYIRLDTSLEGLLSTESRVRREKQDQKCPAQETEICPGGIHLYADPEDGLTADRFVVGLRGRTVPR